MEQENTTSVYQVHIHSCIFDYKSNLEISMFINYVYFDSVLQNVQKTCQMICCNHMQKFNMKQCLAPALSIHC